MKSKRIVKAQVQLVVMAYLIDVFCIAFPNGQTIWIPSGDEKYLRECVTAWKRKYPQFEDTKTTMGVIQIRMPSLYYKNICTTNDFPWP